MKTEEISRLFDETLNWIAKSRLQKDGRAEYNEMYRYGLGEKRRYLTTLMFVNSAIQPLGYKAKILDIGCGAGLMALMFKRIGLEVSTTEIADPPPIKNYGLLLKKTLHSNNITFNEYNIISDNIPFANETFDFVYMGALFEHLPSHHKKGIQEARRVLKKGGYLIIDTPNIAYFANRIKLLLGRPILAPIEQFYNIDGYVGHYREFTLEEMQSVLKYSGFEVAKRKMLNLSLSPVLKYSEGLSRTGKFLEVITFYVSTVISSFLTQTRQCIWIVGKKLD
ncbi:class I SAM-dependent methyltransferase [Chloroflexota bacterium]